MRAFPQLCRLASSLLLASGLAVAQGAAADCRVPALQQPLRFLVNAGQWDDSVAFCSSGGDAVSWVFVDGFSQRFERRSASPTEAGGATADGALLRIRVRDGGGRPVGESPAPGLYHFHRNGRSVTTGAFGSARVVDVLPGVDLVVRPQAVDGAALAYDLHLDQAAALGDVVIDCQGCERIALDGSGGLTMDVRLPSGEVVSVQQSRPVCWQVIDGQHKPVEVAFRTLSATSYGFVGGDLVLDAPLVVDPGVAWSTLFGGGASDSIFDVTRRPGRGVWIAGYTSSFDLPGAGTGGNVLRGATDAFVARLEDDGRTLLWTAYIGGSDADEGRGLAVDDGERPVVVGWTHSTDFPVSSGAFQPVYSGASSILDIGDAFCCRLSADGSQVVGSTFLGAALDDVAEDVAIGPGGDAFVVGWTVSPFLPTSPGAVQPSLGGPVTLQSDGFVVRLSPDAGTLVYGTYLGGQNSDALTAIAVDATGRATVAGRSISPDYPMGPLPLQPSKRGSLEGVVSRLSPDATSLEVSTYLGGTASDELLGVALAADGSAWLAGYSTSSDLALPASALQSVLAGRQDAWLAHLSLDGRQLLASTLLGGDYEDAVRDIEVLADGSVLVVGESQDLLPYVSAGAPQQTFGGGQLDGFAAHLDSDLSGVRFATMLGGDGDDMLLAAAAGVDGMLLVAGTTFSSDFVTTPGALQTTRHGASDGMLLLLDPLRALSGGLVVQAAPADPLVTLAVGSPAVALPLELHNTTGRLLSVTRLEVFVGGTVAAGLAVDALEVWLDDPQTNGVLDLQVGGPVPLSADLGRTTVDLGPGAVVPPGQSVQLSVVVRPAVSLPDRCQLQAVTLGPEAWIVEAEGVGGAPAVAVLSPARIGGPVMARGPVAFPGDLDADGQQTVLDVRRMCRAIGESVPPTEDPDGDGVITSADVALLRASLLERPSILGCPAQVEPGQWITVDGWLPTAGLQATLGGRALSTAAVTGRSLALFVPVDQVAGPTVLELRASSGATTACVVEVL